MQTIGQQGMTGAAPGNMVMNRPGVPGAQPGMNMMQNQANMGQTGAGVLSSGQSNIVLPTTCYISILYMYVYCILYKFMGNVSK